MNDAFETPRVAVIIPTRDRHELLKAAVRSVLVQTFIDLEVWIVDDGSDHPVRVEEVTEVRDARVQLVRLDTPLGAAAARNLGAEKATAPLLAFLDDDDEWLPTKLDDQVRAITADAKTAAVFSGFQAWQGSQLAYTRIPPPQQDLKTTLLKEPLTGPPMVLIRRDVFRELGGFDEKLDRYEDWDLWLRLVQEHEMVPLSRVHVRVRLHDSLSPRRRLHHHVRMYRRLKPYMRRFPWTTRANVRFWHIRRLVARIVQLCVSAVSPRVWTQLQRVKDALVRR